MCFPAISLRMRLLAHFGLLLEDVAIAGPDRDFAVALFFPALEACRKLCPDLPLGAPAAAVFSQLEVRAVFKERMLSFASFSTGGTTRIDRAILLDMPPSIDAQEITDKGTPQSKSSLEESCRSGRCPLLRADSDTRAYLVGEPLMNSFPRMNVASLAAIDVHVNLEAVNDATATDDAATKYFGESGASRDPRTL